MTHVSILADESCDFSIVRALRAAGHDVTSVMEQRAGIPDRDVARWAVAENRVVLTEDKDFGYLVHVADVQSVGVILLRYPASARKTMPAVVVDAMWRLGERLRGGFAVVAPDRVRVRRAARGAQDQEK